MSHTFSPKPRKILRKETGKKQKKMMHLNPEKYWKNTEKTGKKQKKIMHVTHILNPPRSRKNRKKTEEENACHTHSQST